MELYIVKYSANECDDLGYENPIPIYYSLDEKKARTYFEKLKAGAKQHIEQFLNEHPEFINDDDYKICEETENRIEYNMGKWFYELEFDVAELDKDLQYLD